jgi:hypothetical protein
MKSWLLGSKILDAKATVVRATVITIIVIALEAGVIIVYRVVNETPPIARGSMEVVEQLDRETSQDPTGSTSSIPDSEVLIPEQASARSEYQPPPP